MSLARRALLALSQLLPLTLLALVAITSLSACESRLPGPLECEQMSKKLLGSSPEELAEDPRKRTAFATVTNGCLTTPFDHQAVRCVETRRELVSCAEELAWRAPERKLALQKLMRTSIPRN